MSLNYLPTIYSPALLNNKRSKINTNILTKDIIYQAIERAKYIILSEVEDKPLYGFNLMNNLNDLDRLGLVISKDLALDLYYKFL